MTEYTRLLAVGRVRRADVMVPSDEPFAVATPWLLDVLDEQSDGVGAGLSIVRVDGTHVDLEQSPRDQALLDGEVVRFVRTEDAPAPAEVSDVTTAVADAYSRRRLPWNERARHGLASVGVAASAFLVAIGGLPGIERDLRWAWLTAIGIGFALLAAALRPWPARFAAMVLTGAAVGTVAAAAAVGVFSAPTVAGEWWRIGVAYVAVWSVLGLGVGVGLRSRAAVAGAVAALVPAAAAVVSAALGADVGMSWSVVGVVTVAVLGLVPWYVVAISGLAGLDDQVAQHGQTLADGADPLIRRSYAVSAWTTVALALPVGAAGVVLAATRDPWAAWLALAIAIVTALRTRVAPGRVEQAALWAAAFAVAVALTYAWTPAGAPGWVLAGAAGLIAVAAWVRPPEHVRARLRRWGNLLEWLAVVALVPLLLGVYDLYAELLGTFSS